MAIGALRKKGTDRPQYTRFRAGRDARPAAFPLRERGKTSLESEARIAEDWFGEPTEELGRAGRDAAGRGRGQRFAPRELRSRGGLRRRAGTKSRRRRSASGRSDSASAQDGTRPVSTSGGLSRSAPG
ncbi:MAG: hypothetical protein Kow0092_37640 [Deferrisomatales bacterium]